MIYNNCLLTALLATLLCATANGQITGPPTPQLPVWRPVDPRTGQPAHQAPPNNAPAWQQQPTRPPMGGTADQILRQAQHQQQAHNPPDSRRELQEALAELRREEQRQGERLQETEALAARRRYQSAFAELCAMAEGRQPLSFRRAVFVSENAWYGNLDWAAWQADLRRWASLAKTIAKNRYPNEPLGPYVGLFHIFRDTFSYKWEGKLRFHGGFPYDFNDPFGDHDWTKGHVAKLMRTGSGQCQSLTYLYAMIAEEMGLKCWMAHAPMHLFIKHPDGHGGFVNIEVTSKQLTLDQNYESQFGIARKGIDSRYYLDTIGGRRMVALTIADLAKDYRRKVGLDSLTQRLLEKTLEFYPDCPMALESQSAYRYQYLVIRAKAYGNPPQERLQNYPELRELWQRAEDGFNRMLALGYVETTREAYQAWQQEMAEHVKGLQNTRE